MAIEELTYTEKSVIELEQECDQLVAKLIRLKKNIKTMATKGRLDGLTWLKDQMFFVHDEIDRMTGD